MKKGVFNLISLLIMDDEEIIVDGLFHLLKNAKNFELTLFKAYHADEGLDIILHNTIDIVLSDICMPGMSGIELLEVVNQKGLKVKFIFLTAYDNFQYIQDAIRKGGFDYILKTESDERIIVAIDRVIEKIRYEDQERHSILELYPVNVEQHPKALLLYDKLKSLDAVHIMLDNSDQNQLHLYFNEIFEVLKCKHAFSQKMLEKIFYNISFMFNNYLNEKNLNIKLNEIFDLSKLININYFSSADEIKGYYFELIDKIIACLTLQKIEINHVVDFVNKYIKEHIDEDISVNRLAELVYLNPSYFSRFYKQITGITITNFIAEIKLDKAKKMLKDSNLKVNQIAEKLGFESSSYFIRFFKKYMRYSPQEYRDKL